MVATLTQHAFCESELCRFKMKKAPPFGSALLYNLRIT